LCLAGDRRLQPKQIGFWQRLRTRSAAPDGHTLGRLDLFSRQRAAGTRLQFNDRTALHRRCHDADVGTRPLVIRRQPVEPLQRAIRFVLQAIALKGADQLPADDRGLFALAQLFQRFDDEFQ